MCGIAGIIDRDGTTSAAALVALADGMAARLRHRGPDDQGAWSDADAGVGLAFRRLAVMDVSPAGRQPMVSADGRWVVIFNGELYNHPSLRTQLEAFGTRFRGHSDTETLVEAIARWGLERTLDRVDGMFGLAAWDRGGRHMHLVRDRIGEKPLLYGWLGSHFVFASELSAFAAHPRFSPAISLESLALYFRLGYIPSPQSVHPLVSKLPSAHWLTIGPTGAAAVRPYWLLADTVERLAPQRRRPRPLEDAAEELDHILRTSVAARLTADVPVGAFLSSGTDSSAVVSAATTTSSQAVSTFTVAFPEAGPADEAPAAAAVAERLGTTHHEVAVTESNALSTVPEVPTIYDEPFADPAALPSLLICRAARQAVTVCLSGDGGDELFGGYGRYRDAARLCRSYELLPAVIRSVIGRSLEGTARRLPSGALAWAEPLHKLAGASAGGAATLAVLARRWTTHEAILNIPVTAPATAWDEPTRWPTLESSVEQQMYVDSILSLPEQMLTKVDRASMSCSLEMRLPLLAPSVIELAWSLPVSVRVGPHGSGKAVLRKVLSRYLPIPTVPKRGFDPPLGRWLRGPLRPWAEELLNDPAGLSAGIVNVEVASAAWRQVLAGNDRAVLRIWSVLALRAWAANHRLAL